MTRRHSVLPCQLEEISSVEARKDLSTNAVSVARRPFRQINVSTSQAQYDAINQRCCSGFGNRDAETPRDRARFFFNDCERLVGI